MTVVMRALYVQLESLPNSPSFPRTWESRLSTSEIVESLDSRVRGNDGNLEFTRPSDALAEWVSLNFKAMSLAQALQCLHPRQQQTKKSAPQSAALGQERSREVVLKGLLITISKQHL